MKSKADEFKMPKWMECTWRRTPCNKGRCKICGPINKDREKHIDAGEDPDSWESAFADVGKNLRQTLEMIKQDAAAKGIDITNLDDIQEPPSPSKFPLYTKVKNWWLAVHKLVEAAELDEEMWLYTPEGEDLIWYSLLLPKKVYRQQCNRWHLKMGDNYGEFEYEYTQYVLQESAKILKYSLFELMKIDSKYKSKFLIILTNLQALELKILKI